VKQALRLGLTRARGALYGVKGVHFATEKPGARRVHRAANITLAYLGQGERADTRKFELALEDLRAIKAESPQYPVVCLVDGMDGEAALRIRRMGLEPMDARALSTEARVRAFVENKVIELRLGLPPPLLPETIGLQEEDPNVLQAIWHEFAAAPPPVELWAEATGLLRRILLITFTYFARACRRLATRSVEGRPFSTAFVLTHRAGILARSLGSGGGTVLKLGPRELRVSIGGIHEADMEEIARVARWPGSFVVIDETAMIRAIVARTRDGASGREDPSPEAFARLLRRRPAVGFLVPGDRSVRVFAGDREILRHDGFEWRVNNRPAVREVFEHACIEAGVQERVATRLFAAATILAEERHGCFAIVGREEAVRPIAQQSVPLARARIGAAIEAGGVESATPAVLAGLAAQDGALIMDGAGRVLGFGRLVRTRDRPQETAEAHGTKHATAAQVTLEREDVCSLVVSQDGPASVYHKGQLIARTLF
jgi:hypothetical protein